ncbi:DUF1877 family protein [Micromonospora sp. NPDC003197]
MYLSFTRVTPEELDRAVADPEWAEKNVFDGNLQYCSLDKSWAGIQFLLDEAEVDVDVYEDGCFIDDACTLFGWDVDNVDWLRHYHQELVEFFEATAASGGAMIRSFSF